MATIRTYTDTASSLELWREYVDPDMTFSEKEFESMSLEERIAVIVETHGPESTDGPSCNE